MSALHLFEGYGVEIEYMLVAADGPDSLNVLPVADTLLSDAAGTTEVVEDLELGPITWSNELVLHVLELKCSGPAQQLAGLASLFQEHVTRANSLLVPMGGRLMPTGAHPWMNPLTDTRLWPHDCGIIYQTYDRIFGCKGHGWSNLQSMHINLPFNGDEEFGRLHAAIRALLPLMPALTASTPILDGAFSGYLDGRMHAYATNSKMIPTVAGRIVPEAVFTRADYDERIFAPMFAAIAPHDPDNVLRDEFLNSRGAIARFGRGAIEIRVLDTQEHPGADLACAGLICSALRALCDGRLSDPQVQRELNTDELANVLHAVIRDADQTVVRYPALLAALGFPAGRGAAAAPTAAEVWAYLEETCLRSGMQDGGFDPDWVDPLATIAGKGCLSRRILEALGGDTRREALAEVYGELCSCLEAGRSFGG